MRKLFLVFGGVLLSVALSAQVDFQELSLKDACQKARMENKPIFMDCYTTWCGPCKRMANEVFALKEAGVYFNKAFVCVKKDMEKTDGRTIAKQYGVDSYPTFLMINAEGELMHKFVGAMSLNKLVEQVEQGLNAGRIAEYAKRYQAGTLDLAKQLEYWELLFMAGEEAEAQKVGNLLWKEFRNNTFSKMAELAQARGEGDYRGFLDALSANLNEWSDQEKDFIFEGALTMSHSNDKNLHKELGEIAFQAALPVQDEKIRENIRSVAFFFRRIGNSGVYWESSPTLESILMQAAKENKYVFLFCHSEGQGFHAVNDLLMREEIGDAVNHSFINYRLNVEKGFGRWVAKMYNIAPNTIIVLHADGSLRHVITGMQINNLVDCLEEVFDDNKALGVLVQKYEQGERSSEFMKNYLLALQKVSNLKAGQIASELFQLLNDEQKVSKEYGIVFNPQLSMNNTEIKNYLLDNYQRFKQTIGEKEVQAMVVNQIYADLMNPLYDVNSKVSMNDINRITDFLKKESTMPHAMQLLDLSKIIMLYKKDIYQVKPYKKAAKNLNLETLPFADLYTKIIWAAPEKTEEWKAWGTELINACTNENVKLWYEKLMK